DPWTLLEDRKPEEVSSPFSQYLEKKMEQSVIQRANAVITTTDNLAEALQAEDKNSKNKYYVVYNGYDEHDFPPTKPNPKFDDRFTFTYLGSFYRERSPKFFFLAIRKLIDEDLFSFANIKIRLIGNVKTARGESVQKMAEEFSLEDIVEFYDFVPYKEALQYMVYSNVLILMAPNQYYQIPGKTFEYLATKNPILALVDEGATADLIQKLCAGVTVKWSDVSDIKNAVQELFKTYLNGEDKYSQYNQTLFSRKALTKQLSDIMTQLQ
ncbi:MAG: glycosyltransferase, partial [Bacteroidota bacterium]